MLTAIQSAVGDSISPEIFKAIAETEAEGEAEFNKYEARQKAESGLPPII